MSWSSDFVAELSRRTTAVRFTLVVLEVDGLPGTAFTVRSAPIAGDTLALGRVTEIGGQLDVRGRSSTIGAFEAELVGDISALLTQATRGSLLELRLGWPGWDEADFERISAGVLKNIRAQGGSYKLEVWDLFSAFRGRCSVEPSDTVLNGSLGSTTVRGGAGWVTSDTTFPVDAVDDLERETGGEGLVRVTPTTGAPFYVRYGGTSGGNTLASIVGGAHGTTAVDADEGDVVQACFYVADHPVDVARKVIVSTGAGTNGTYDTLPLSWGLAVPDDLVDHDDCDTTRGIVSGGFAPYNWEVVSTEPITDGLAWLSGLLAEGGMFLTQRQGLVTVRALQEVDSAAAVLSLTDADIMRVDDYDSFAPDYQQEYCYVQALYNGGADFVGGSAINESATLPLGVGAYDLSIMELDLGEVCFGTNDEAMAEEVVLRVEGHYRRVPERLLVRCAGLRAAQLAPLDWVELTTGQVQSRTVGRTGFAARKALVLAVARDWQAGTVRLELRVYPESEDTFA